MNKKKKAEAPTEAVKKESKIDKLEKALAAEKERINKSNSEKLIVLGNGIIEILGYDQSYEFSKKDVKIVLDFLKEQEKRGCFFSKFMAKHKDNTAIKTDVKIADTPALTIDENDALFESEATLPQERIPNPVAEATAQSFVEVSDD